MLQNQIDYEIFPAGRCCIPHLKVGVYWETRVFLVESETRASLSSLCESKQAYFPVWSPLILELLLHFPPLSGFTSGEDLSVQRQSNDRNHSQRFTSAILYECQAWIYYYYVSGKNAENSNQVQPVCLVLCYAPVLTEGVKHQEGVFCRLESRASIQ